MNILIIIILFHFSLEHNVNFCKNEYKCLGGVKHTICELKHNCGEGIKCKNYKSMPLKYEEKEELLDLHNKLRNAQALGKGRRSHDGSQFPTATNMREMVWDDELEFLAQCWANQCPTDHDRCRKTSGGVKIGQNLGYSTNDEIQDVIKVFYDEASRTPIALIERFDNEYQINVIKHFTQLVYWNSTLLGCGRSKFFFPKLKAVTVILVCNYASVGNLDRKAVYKTGTPCTSCPKNSQCHKKYKGLCTTEPSESEVPSICEFSEDKLCKPILLENLKKKAHKNKNSTKDGRKYSKIRINKAKPKIISENTPKYENRDPDTSDKMENKENLTHRKNVQADQNDCINNGDDDGVCIIERKIIVDNSNIGCCKQIGNFLLIICISIIIYVLN